MISVFLLNIFIIRLQDEEEERLRMELEAARRDAELKLDDTRRMYFQQLQLEVSLKWLLRHFGQYRFLQIGRSYPPKPSAPLLQPKQSNMG